MTPEKERLISALQHQGSCRIPVDLGGTAVTGIHILIVEKLRQHYGLKLKPVKLTEPYQMLGEIEEDLMEAMGVDVMGLTPEKNMFGFRNSGWKPFITPWKQEILVPGDFNVKKAPDGGLLMSPEGDLSLPPSARMPTDSYFFDAVIRQKPLDEASLDPEDNLEEFTYLTSADLEYWSAMAEKARISTRGIIATFGGTALGDIALVPAMQLRDPKGIRDISEWYMSTIARTDYIHRVFEKQTDIAVANYEKLAPVMGDTVDAVFICGTDFGTQSSQFCSPETFNELYAPYYKKINDWIHQNTGWKTFKHSCGAVEPFMQLFIDAGFDIINPVQINAAGMDPVHLKKEYGDHIVFWGGGIDTQITLPFSTPGEVKKQVLKNCEVFSVNGGFVFNTVHNIQANVPVENVVAMLEALKEFNR